MKKVIVMLLLCLLVSGCGVSTWAWGDRDGLGARVGTRITPNNEIGASAVFWEEDCEPRVLGLYAIRHFPEPIEFRNPLILDFLPETLAAKAYIGGIANINKVLDETIIGPVAGIIIEDTLFIEYQYRSFDEGSTGIDSKVLFGLKYDF